MTPAITDAAQALINLILGELGIAILVVGIIALYLIWYLRGRDKPVGLIAEYLREPPSDLHPGVVGTLIDEHANYHDIVATLVNLGERGALHIRPLADGQGQIRDYSIELGRRDLRLSKVEKLLFDLLFSPKGKPKRTQVAMSSLKADFEKSVAKFKLALYDEVVEHGFFSKSPRDVRDRYWTIGCSLMVAAVVIGIPIALLVESLRLIVIPVVALIILGIIIYNVARAMPVKTELGALEAARWLAFRRYLADIKRYEGDVAEVKNIFRRYLPYATAFGLEQHWLQTFKQADPPAPTWYEAGEIIVVAPGTFDMPNVAGTGGGINLPDLGALASAIPTDLPDLGGAGDAAAALLEAASSGGGAGLEAASEGLSGLLDAASSLFDW